MATVHKGYRLDAELVGRLDAWAEAHGMTQAEAVRKLLATALEDTGASRDNEGLEVEEPPAAADDDTRAMLGEHIRDLRATVSTLTTQVAEKDRQIARLHDIAEHSQMLEAAHVAGRLAGAVEDNETGERPRGVWAWLARKIDGR